MTHVVCVKPIYAELTEGDQYKVYGEYDKGVIVRNDFGLLLTYGKDFFNE